MASNRIWNVVKDEPEDLTGRQTEDDKAALQRSADAQTNTGDDSGSDSDSDLCIDEQVIMCRLLLLYFASAAAVLLITALLLQRAPGPRKRRNTVPASVMNGVTPAELQKRPGLIPLTSNLAGPVQVMTAKDGAKLYSCPECNLFYADHLAFEIHLQGTSCFFHISFWLFYWQLFFSCVLRLPFNLCCSSWSFIREAPCL